MLKPDSVPLFLQFNSPSKVRKFSKVRQARAPHIVRNELLVNSIAEFEAVSLEPITTRDIGI